MRETILIIEDEEDIRNLLSSLLESEGYRIYMASNGLEGIKKFQEHEPDLVLTDVRMPLMDGIEVLREIKTKELDAEVIVLTGHSDEATAIDCLRLGAYDYFRKPLEDIDVLLAAVERALEKRNLEIKNRSLVKQLQELSTKDPLTGLYNYRYLQTCLNDVVERSTRYGHSFFILMIDLDHFKEVNDKFGHLFGDFVLKKTGHIIQYELRSSDRLFRYGGEEFLILMNEISQKDALKTVERLMDALRGHVFKQGQIETQITASMGGAFFPGDAQDKVELIQKADQALYLAKKSGRDRFECCLTLPNDTREGVDLDLSLNRISSSTPIHSCIGSNTR